MLYCMVHEDKKFLAWHIEDIVRNTRNFLYSSEQTIYFPSKVKFSVASLNIFADIDQVENEQYLSEGPTSQLRRSNLISFNRIL